MPRRSTTPRTKRDDPRGELDPRAVKAIAHPVRHRILRSLNERAASPKELAAELEQPLANVSYHVRILADLGCIELVDTQPRRGALEHYYRAVMRPFFSDEDWALLPLSSRRTLFDQQLLRIFDDVSAAASTGGFDHPRTHVSWSPLDLDQAAYDELADRLNDLLDRALQLHAESAARQLESGNAAPARTTSELVLLHFQRTA
jgi:DNA-binding transcriptional ArsR family regulator